MSTSEDKKPARRAVSKEQAASTSGRGRPKLRVDSVDRRDAILDAAEALFSVNGFYGVTVREVAARVGVDATLLNYYFESKRGLFDAVFKRRAEIANIQRMNSMNRYRDSTAVMTVEGCLQAYFEPVLHWWETGGDGWKNYQRLVALINITPSWGSDVMAQHFDPVIHRLIELLRETLPAARDVDLYWCYHFVSGALSLSIADTGRIDTLSGGLCHSSDVAAVRKRFAFFMAAGTTALCNSLANAKP